MAEEINFRLEHFERLAQKRKGKRRLSAYYWNDITKYCNYFSHDDLTVLEIGCGSGELIGTIKGRVKTGIDFSPSMIEFCKSKYAGVNFYCMAAEKITLTEKYDLIILSNLVGHLDDIQKVFESLHKLCHSRTKIFISYFSYLWEPILKLAEFTGLKTPIYRQNWLSIRDLNNILYLSGYDVYRNTTRMLVPVWLPIISGIFNRYIAPLPLFKHLCINHFAFAKPLPEISNRDIEQRYSVSVVIPARNESGNIEDAVKRLPSLGKHTEIIFIEGNSTDDTWESMEKVKSKYSVTHDIKTGRQTGKGKGDAVRKGFDMATGDILMILDADLTVPPEDLLKFYHAIASDKGDFINGSRLVYPMEKEAMRFLNLLGNKFFSFAFSWLLNQPFKDTLCGSKVIFRDDYKRLIANRSFFGNFDPFGDFDLIFGAYKLNLKIVEVPIRYRERTYGATNISRFTHGILLLKMCAFAARKIKFI